MAFGHGLVKVLEGVVEVGDVGLVVLLVVELHDLSTNVGHQCPIVVG